MRRINLKFLKRFLFFVFAVGVILFSSIPFHFLPNYPYRFNWVFVPIFYFAIYDPKCLSVWAVFLLGLLMELLTQSPLGVTTFCYILIYFVANFFRKYLLEMTFWPLWSIFSGLLLGVLLLEYSIVFLFAAYPVSFQPVLVEFWMLVLVYPFFIRFCAYADKKMREVS